MIRNELFQEKPTFLPKPMTLCVERVISKWDILAFEGNLHILRERIKSDLSHDLANNIIDKCQLIEFPEVFKEGAVVRLELSINDRGRYENWLPIARDEGKKEGIKQAIENLPYGLEIGNFPD